MAANMFLPIVLVLLAASLVSGIALSTKPKTQVVGRVLVVLPLAAGLFVVWAFSSLMLAFTSSRSVFYISLAAVVAVLVFSVIMFAMCGVLRRKPFWIPLVCAVGICFVAGGGVGGYDIYRGSLSTVGEPDNMLWDYRPYGEASKAARLDAPSTLAFEYGDELPRIDGATALYPIYAAFAQAVYHEALLGDEPFKYVDCTKTPSAYDRLIKGEADVIFVSSASDKQQQAAKQAGVELVFTPIGKEAFVFFVNSRNPVENITISQIQDIYEGKLTNWNELGANLGSIRAFQRPEGSGSQTSLQKLMQGRSLTEPPKEDVVAGMGGIISQVSDYRNFKNALGFSFRFYSTEMVQNNEIKLLAIDGVAPTRENIRNGSYPIVGDFYAVTRTDATEDTKRLVEWVCSAQGQELIEKTGYVSMG